MIPNIEDRLSSMQRALQEAILPALPADQSLAIEQAHLLLAHLGLLREQIDLAPALERDEHDSLVALGGRLAATADGGPRTRDAAAALDALLGRDDPAGPAALRERIVALSLAIETLIEASGIDGGDAFVARSSRDVIAHADRTTQRDRAWFRSTGFERGEVELPPIASLLG